MTDIRSTTPVTEASKQIRRAADDMELLERENDKIRKDHGEARFMVDSLTQENNLLRQRYDVDTKVLREELEQTRRQRDQLQAYAVGLTTKIDMLVEIIASVKRDAMQSSFTLARPQAQPRPQNGNGDQHRAPVPNISLVPPVQQPSPPAPQAAPAPIQPPIEHDESVDDGIAEIVNRLPRNEY